MEPDFDRKHRNWESLNLEDPRYWDDGDEDVEEYVPEPESDEGCLPRWYDGR